MRRCMICGKEKEDEFFIHDKYAKGGIRNVCLECNKKRAKMRRATIQKHLEELEKKLNDYTQIASISIDMSTEEAPYNRIYAKPIEKQGDVLLCEFESANYDMSKKGKDFTTGISEEMYLDQLKVKENMIKSYQEENAKLEELLKEAKKREDIIRKQLKDAQKVMIEDYSSLDYLKGVLSRQEIGNYTAQESLEKIAHDWEKDLDKYCKKWCEIKY